MAHTSVLPQGAEARPLTIIDMPPEILREIFDEFMDCRLDDPTRIDWMDFREDDEISMKRDALKNARLTCRTLCEAASPYLIPMVQVRIEQTSLDRLEAISRSPLLASGVRALEVNLRCRPGGTDTPDRYRFLDLWRRHGQTVGELTPALRERIAQWDNDTDPTMDALGDFDGEVVEQCESIIKRSLTLHRALRGANLVLITSGTFTSTVAAAVSRMPRFSTLLFRDWDRQLPVPIPQLGACTTPVFVIQPTGWKEVEATPEGGIRPSARLLSEIPIAIHDAGVALRAIYVDYFPTRNDIDVFSTSEPRELSAAFQHLEQVNFLRYQGEGRDNPYHPCDEQPVLINYIGALLSSPRLKHVDISAQRYSTINMRDAVRCIKPM
ncbi:hypothetical protein IMZ48_36455, partial [Candidatus Bathyarchaeota archaeon]|nr:hypothetical protein [Candidatus Bathyarchaeota archaeon]